VNRISSSLVTVLQGTGGSIENILDQTAELTSALADRDQLIGSVIANLNKVLGTVAKHDSQLDQGLGNLQQLISGLSAQSGPIADSLTNLGGVSKTVSSLLTQTRPDIKNDVTQINRFSSQINSDHGYMDNLLTQLPGTYRTLSRLGLYGAFFTFYICDATLKLNGPHGDPIYIDVAGQRAGRCTAK
jgi:phospholipid/cholesterol/gamma-HCH transport system substrate-binding protein